MAQNDNIQRQQEKEAQGAVIKEAVKQTMDKLAVIDNQLSEYQKIKSALKRDLSDMAEGRLDRIFERHTIDEVSAGVSVFRINLKVEVGAKTVSPWYVPYILRLNGEEHEVNNSIAKTYAKGSYKLTNGDVRYL